MLEFAPETLLSHLLPIKRCGIKQYLRLMGSDQLALTFVQREQLSSLRMDAPLLFLVGSDLYMTESLTASKPPARPNAIPDTSWYSDHREELMAYAIKHFRISSHCADDIVQAVYLRMQNADSEILNPRQYAYRITHNLCIDLKRKEKSMNSLNDHVAEHSHTQNDLCPERTISARQLLTKLNNVIWKMPEKRRKLFTMHRFQELSFAEIGRQTGLSESAVRKHVAKALAECHQAMGKDDV